MQQWTLKTVWWKKIFTVSVALITNYLIIILFCINVVDRNIEHGLYFSLKSCIYSILYIYKFIYTCFQFFFSVDVVFAFGLFHFLILYLISLFVCFVLQPSQKSKEKKCPPPMWSKIQLKYNCMWCFTNK